MTDAAALKNQGNEHFQNGDWLKAAALYTQALKLDPDNAVLYSNRSAALLKLKKVKKAQEDAERAVALRPEWDKGYIRRAAIHEELENLAEALEEYTVASKLNPGNKEMSQKVRTLSKLVKVRATTAGITGDQACSSGVAKSHQPASTNPVAHAPQATLPSPSSSSSNGEAEVVYEDMGSEEVAKFAEAHLGLLAEEVRENGSDFIPMVHLLPGPASISTEEQEQHVRGAGAFDTPQTLDGFVCFLREKAARLDSLAALSLVPKASVAYPQTWTKAKWPCGGADGVFAQLESHQVRRLWFVPVQGTAIGTPVSLDYDSFSPVPRLLRPNS